MTDKLPKEFAYEYRVTLEFSRWRYVWIMRGVHGAVHFHCHGPESDIVQNYGPSAGLECHYRHPPAYMMTAPSHEKCGIIGGPCWHDGTSLYATETLYPLIDWKNPLEFFSVLIREMERLDPRPGEEDKP